MENTFYMIIGVSRYRQLIKASSNVCIHIMAIISERQCVCNNVCVCVCALASCSFFSSSVRVLFAWAPPSHKHAITINRKCIMSLQSFVLPGMTWNKLELNCIRSNTRNFIRTRALHQAPLAKRKYGKLLARSASNSINVSASERQTSRTSWRCAPIVRVPAANASRVRTAQYFWSAPFP